MKNFLKIVFVMGLALAFPVFGAVSPENCTAAKRGDHVTGKYASLLRCAKDKNCPTYRRPKPTKRQKVKKPQGGTPDGSR
ncbi:MAG: hypothetical protein OXB86_03445 [Bdellovibrionales bacterium]|nr:hypothetical protein [Bdellovibrionales bacterium]